MLISTQPFIHFVLEAKARLKRLKAAKIPALIAEKIVFQPSFYVLFSEISFESRFGAGSSQPLGGLWPSALMQHEGSWTDKSLRQGSKLRSALKMVTACRTLCARSAVETDDQKARKNRQTLSVAGP